VVFVDNGAKGAVYMGLAIGVSSVGPTLYAANFSQGTIDTFVSGAGCGRRQHDRCRQPLNEILMRIRTKLAQPANVLIIANPSAVTQATKQCHPICQIFLTLNFDVRHTAFWRVGAKLLPIGELVQPPKQSGDQRQGHNRTRI